MADVKENIRTPEKSLVPPGKPDAKPIPSPIKKDVPIGIGVITPEMERYRAILAKDASSRVFAALAELYRKAGMLDEAINLCLNGTKAHPKYMSGRVALGRAYFDKGMIKESKEEILKVVSITPDNIVAHRVLGDICLQEGDAKKARESFAKVLALSPDDAEVKEKLATIDRGPQKGAPKAAQPEDILEGETLELVQEGGGEIIEDAQLLDEDEATTAGADGLSLDDEEIEIPTDSERALDSEGSLGDLVGEETSRAPDDGRALAETVRTEGEPSSSESESVRSEAAVEDGAVDEDQGLVDEFGILEEGEEEISIEGFSDRPVPSTGSGGQRDGTSVMGQSPGTEGGKTRGTVPSDRQDGETDATDAKGVTITTETIADIYVKQGYYDKALSIYEELLGTFPTRDSLKQKIGFVKKRMKEAAGPGEMGEGSIPIESPADEAGLPLSGEEEGQRRTIEGLNRWLLNIRKYRRS